MSGSVDVPRAPRGADGWDARSRGLVPGAAGAAGEAGPGDGTGGGPGSAAAPRSAPVDPVKALMHRHRELCERAVDPLEIAAGLEAHGVTDRTAARFRHRDVFALAEEMYARVPQDSAEWDALGDDADAGRGDAGPQAPPGWAMFALLPGLACALLVTGTGLTEGRVRLAVAVGGALALAAAVRFVLRYGPLRTARPGSTAGRAGACWLLAYALLGDWLVRGALAGGGDGSGLGGFGGDGFPVVWASSAAVALGLAVAVAPGAWCARLFAARVHGRLGASRGLAEFAASVRPLLIVVFGLFVCAVGAVLAGARAALGTGAVTAFAGAGALAALLWLGRMLAVHGSLRASALVYGAVGAGEAVALGLAWAGRLPGCGFLAAPVRGAVTAWGAGAVPALACGVGAAVLLAHAVRVLGRASAHAGAGAGGGT
ncbi:hypothetical protein [Streptomyces sp. NPDC059063]|uniref:hypothetical protein n=1 Tax=unclassified Streptomyces TaxID=2593676 RepID=UPI00367E2C55